MSLATAYPTPLNVHGTLAPFAMAPVRSDDAAPAEPRVPLMAGIVAGGDAARRAAIVLQPGLTLPRCRGCPRCGTAVRPLPSRLTFQTRCCRLIVGQF